MLRPGAERVARLDLNDLERRRLVGRRREVRLDAAAVTHGAAVGRPEGLP